MYSQQRTLLKLEEIVAKKHVLLRLKYRRDVKKLQAWRKREYRKIGCQIKLWRVRNNLLIREAAEVLGVSKTQYNNSELGNSNPSLVLKRIHKYSLGK